MVFYIILYYVIKCNILQYNVLCNSIVMILCVIYYSYTYEVAPVGTLMEREIIQKMVKKYIEFPEVSDIQF